MPELPEVETVARQLAPHLVDRTVRGIRVFDPRLRNAPAPRLGGRRVVDVSRSGKRVLIEFSPAPRRGGPVWLAVHLRMTGRLLWIAEGARGRRAHLRARLSFDGGSLSFVDTRRFGTFGWYADAVAARPTGVEPLSAELTVGRLKGLIGDSRQNIKSWLLRQDRLVGLGNIYASEILHAAGISPQREAASLVDEEARRLLRHTRAILRRAIRNCGTTFSDFQDSRGAEGSYQRFLAVYGREGLPCPRCATPIQRRVQQQRSTFFCPRCQS